MSSLFMALTVTMLLVGCAMPTKTTYRARLPDHNTSRPVVNDRAVLGQLTIKGAQLLEKGETVPMRSLIEQLDKSTTTTIAKPLANSVKANHGMERLRKSVVVVGGIYKCDRCTRWHTSPASGFLVDSDIVVTNYHVVNQPDRTSLVVRLFDGQVMPVRSVVAAHEKYDLAILKIDPTGLPGLSLGKEAGIGSGVRVMSHPDRRFYILTEGLVSRYFVHRRNDEPVTAMEITADFGKGSSGAPIFNDQGKVVGVVASTQSLYYDEKDGDPRNLQMVFKICIPVGQLSQLLGG